MPQRCDGRRRPRDLGPAHVEAFLMRLATDQHVSASTRIQALAAVTAFGPCSAAPMRGISRERRHRKRRAGQTWPNGSGWSIDG
ncbi:phage integrase N-terminal SAM-like domain-containing protein [Sorangium sp. So ce367]|uniref:phage integrase N-terminal SAM-like domain-containing protein n=1 Tax=Sorangium sp. So ce367 TaxID=3133305 RepID=UPI003F6234B2